MLSGKHIGLLTVILISGLAFIAGRGGFAAAQAVRPGSAGSGGLAAAQPVSPGSSFRDCVDCPEMVPVPAGSFTMGAQPGEEEREGLAAQFRGRSVPQHRVNIAVFAAGKYDVTRDEYGRFASETNRPNSDSCYTLNASGQIADTNGANWRSPGFTQTSRDPVVCVSWDDARAYAAWLSQKTGKPYRLLSESEWEYAARAGTVTSRYWGENADDQCSYANGADQTQKAKYPNATVANCSDSYFYTSPVGSFRANRFGLYDMLGNVFQWTSDCWNESYDGAPFDGRAWTTGDCGHRVARGGSWNYDPGLLRAASRFGGNLGYRGDSNGFRVARTL